MLNIRINSKEVKAPRGVTILKAAEKLGIDIPTLCHEDCLSSFSGCRICVVEVEGARNLMAACSTEIWEGMDIKTHSEKVIKTRKDILDLMFSNHPNDCLTCEKSGECKLQNYCYQYGIKEGSYKGDRKQFEIDNQNPVMIRDQNKCILCGKCVRMCREVQVTSTIEFTERGFYSKITTGFDIPINTENCRMCGQCISVCPTGALLNKQFAGIRPWEIEKKVTTTCPFCGTGCQFDINVKDGKIIGVTPNENAPVNGTSICVKGRYHTDLVHSPNRLTKPLIKKDGEFVESSWSEAMNLVATKLKTLKSEFGSDSIAGLSSARCVNEDNFLFQKMMRVAIGTNNVDHCART